MRSVKFPERAGSVVFRRLVLIEITVGEIHAASVVRQWAGVWREGNVADGGVFGLAVGDIHRGADFDEAVEFGGEILVHPDAAMRAGLVLNPAGVKAVVGLEFAPVRHRRALE